MPQTAVLAQMSIYDIMSLYWVSGSNDSGVCQGILSVVVFVLTHSSFRL